ncbi:MAG: nitrilase-related carbon-nitrogen hydrolase, partial [Draconibacterium sp.]|nr:nitrilase-related carbon-nitrogen hydrolase [Draconibacterium sp.]
MENKNISRRSFVKKSAIGAGAVGMVSPFNQSGEMQPVQKLPREVYIASFCSSGLRAESPSQMVDIVEGKIQTVFPLKPDIICFPEIFPFFWTVNEKLTVPQQAEFSKSVIDRFLKLAKQNGSWMICPVVTEEAGKYYNAAVVIDRAGKYVGEYRKIHTTVEEMKDGISPGLSDPPVFDTDFGKIGIQICYDVRWDDGWNKLQEKGAEIIFWPSAFPGGQLLNSRALKHHAVIVSSTLKTLSKIVDIDGTDLT